MSAGTCKGCSWWRPHEEGSQTVEARCALRPVFTFSTDSCGDFARRVKRRRMVAKLGDPKGTAKFAPKNPYRPTPEEARANGRKGAAARWARRAAQLAAAAAPE